MSLEDCCELFQLETNKLGYVGCIQIILSKGMKKPLRETALRNPLTNEYPRDSCGCPIAYGIHAYLLLNHLSPIFLLVA